jgi:hypothetical protein
MRKPVHVAFVIAAACEQASHTVQLRPAHRLPTLVFAARSEAVRAERYGIGVPSQRVGGGAVVPAGSDE